MSQDSWVTMLSVGISAIESVILTITLVLMYIQIRQDARHHRESMSELTRSLQSSIHAQILSYLMELNKIPLEYPHEIKDLFPDFSDVQEVRQYSYVFAILDILDYLVLHHAYINPYLRAHLEELAMLLFLNPKLYSIYNEVKDHQNPLLVKYLEQHIKPLVVKKTKKRKTQNK